MSFFNISSVNGWVKKIFPSLRKTQAVNLGLGVFGIVKSRSGLMSEIVRETPGAIKHKHRLKRFFRFVSNPKVKVPELIDLWSLWVIKTFMPGRYCIVALDWTTLPGNVQVLMAAIPYAARAVPLLWVTTTYRAFKDSQNLIEQRLITRLINIIPTGKKVVLVADRGFGRAKFIEFLLKQNLLFSIRVKADVKIKTKEGRIINLRKLKIKVGQVKWFASISYRQDNLIPKVNLAVTLAEPKTGEREDPWLLVTNLRKSQTAISNYKLRFDIEEWFKDLKHQLGVDKLQSRNLDRVRRLVLISAIAYGLLMLVGSLARRLKNIQDQLITGGKRSASRIWFALRIIHYQLLPKLYWKKIWLKAKGASP